MEIILENGMLLKVVEEYYKQDTDISNLLNYTWRMKKEAAYGGTAVYPYCETVICEQFQYVQNYYRSYGRRCMQVVVSFQIGYGILVVENMAKEISKNIGKSFQVIWGIHTDKPNLHIHFAINATSFLDGCKITENYIFQLLKVTLCDIYKEFIEVFRIG